MEKVYMDALELLRNDHIDVKEAFDAYEELGDKAYTRKKTLADEICSTLTIHAMVEEKIFYPAVREMVEEAEDLLDEASIEHAGAKDLIAEIEAMSAEDPLMDATVKVLSEQIQHHVKEEEGEMFPLVKKSKLDLDALGKKMMEMKNELEESM